MEPILHLFLKNFGLSLAGLVGYGLLLYGRKMKSVAPLIFLNNNIRFAIWAISVQLLYSFVLAMFPALELAVANWFIGLIEGIFPPLKDLEIPQENAVTVVYLLGGWLLSLWVKRTTNKNTDANA
ncbi:hypothetical protein [Flagellimonas flava]|uniref:hypothetical protein n=1 Tax=Flagellimonas flava TaxID=570519 RepID=UPI003D646FA6